MIKSPCDIRVRKRVLAALRRSGLPWADRMDLPAKDSIVLGAHNLQACSACVSGESPSRSSDERAIVVTGKPASLATRRQS
jgi:hypothetical protein